MALEIEVHLRISEDIRWLAGFFEDICWKHVYRKAKFLADAITSIGYVAFYNTLLARNPYSRFN